MVCWVLRQCQLKHVNLCCFQKNMRFRRWLKSHTFVERQFRNAAKEISDEIDCRQCGECCRVTEVELTERDVDNLLTVKECVPVVEEAMRHLGTGDLRDGEDAAGHLVGDGDEILRLGGRRGARNYDELMRAADAFAEGRDRDALRILRPLREAMPTSPSTRELYALALYRNGRFKDAARELEEYFSMTGDVSQHPVLMDCYRALGDHETVEARWRELGEESPSSELVTEGRIVLAGSLADRGRLDDAIALLAKRADGIKRVLPHHLRL